MDFTSAVSNVFRVKGNFIKKRKNENVVSPNKEHQLKYRNYRKEPNRNSGVEKCNN